MYDTIVVPTDGSAHAILAAKHARAVATAFDATVHVVSVVDEDAATTVFERGDVAEERLAEMRADGREAVESTRAVLDPVRAVETALVEGHPMESILGYVDDVDGDLVAMGTHGRTGVDRYVAGSVTERVLRRAPVPVLTVRASDPTALPAYDDVLVPTDGSGAASAAVAHALDFAAAGDATVHAVNVVDVGTLASEPTAAPSTALLEDYEEAGQAAVDAVAEAARDAGLDARTQVCHGSPGNVLLEYADEHDPDVIAMGTRGRTGFDRYILGSTTERVVRHADSPVLAVHDAEE